VPALITLDRLHDVIQVVMGRTDNHLLHRIRDRFRPWVDDRLRY
jgi:hypothetical protein